MTGGEWCCSAFALHCNKSLSDKPLRHGDVTVGRPNMVKEPGSVQPAADKDDEEEDQPGGREQVRG